MPHSGGGGSHGGGSHGGGHSSHGSSGRSYVGERTNHFPGSRRYSYVQNGVTHYFYSDRDWTNSKSNKITKIIIIVWVLPFILFGIVPLKSMFHVPKKLDTTNSIVVQDNLGIADRSILDPALKEYQDTTGITPAIVTGVNTDWFHYSSMEDYAYNLYVNMFNKDETYLLIVYTTDPNDTSFDNWYYELMLGDDTSNILDTKETEKLNSNLHSNFLHTSTNFSEDIANALKDSAESSMKFSFEPTNLLFCAFWYGFIILWVTLALKSRKPRLKGYKGEKIELAPEESTQENPVKNPTQMFKNKSIFNNEPTFSNDQVPQSTLLFNKVTCRYCGTTFDIDNKYRCPNCGAQLETWQIEDAKNRFK